MLETLRARACIIAPKIKRMSARRITRFRPRRSARTPAIGLEIRAKKLVEEVIRLLSRVLSGLEERSEPIDTSVEEITPVSYPKRTPLIAEVQAMAQTKGFGDTEASVAVLALLVWQPDIKGAPASLSSLAISVNSTLC